MLQEAVCQGSGAPGEGSVQETVALQDTVVLRQTAVLQEKMVVRRLCCPRERLWCSGDSGVRETVVPQEMVGSADPPGEDSVLETVVPGRHGVQGMVVSGRQWGSAGHGVQEAVVFRR